MSKVFPITIRKLPQADIPLEGLTAFLSQSSGHQILFLEFERDVDLSELSHNAQVGFILEGRIELVNGGEKHRFTKGDCYNIPQG